jgi:hypothetical protein
VSARRPQAIGAAIASLMLLLAGAGCVEPKPAPALPPIRLKVSKVDEGRAAFQVLGLAPDVLADLRRAPPASDGWAAIFAVRVVPPDVDPAGLPPVHGGYTVDDDGVVFTTRFPLEPGLRYRAVFDPLALAREVGRGAGTEGVALPYSADFEVPARVIEPTTEVSAVYPSADRVPENLLKFYVHFSAPMSRGEAYRRTRLLREDGSAVELPFLEIDEELWNSEGTRLTLFFDPGRLKREVTPLEEIGPALEDGRSYTLSIDAAWPDARGAPLRRGFEKRFRVGPPDREPPDPQGWRIEAPAAGTRDALRVVASEPLDHALLVRLLSVEDAGGGAVAGAAAVGSGETSWSFAPEAPWRAGAHALVIDTVIEDLAGNNVGKRFEVDLFEKVEREPRRDFVRVPFTVEGR